MGDHGNTHTLKLAAISTRLNPRQHILIAHRGPIDTDEVAVSVIARFFAMPRQAAVSAIGATAFGIGHQQIQTMRARGAMHFAWNQAQRNRRRRAHLHIFRRAHGGRFDVVIGTIKMDRLRVFYELTHGCSTVGLTASKYSGNAIQLLRCAASLISAGK